MKFHELPDDLIVEVFYLLPEFVVYQLLKSTTCAKQAYEVYYKQVYVGNRRTCSRPEDFGTKAKYLNEYNAPDMRTKIKQGSINRRSSNELNPTFNSPRQLLHFYRSHPLFEPHTLKTTLEDLVILNKLKPGFVKKFKHIICCCTDEYDPTEYIAPKAAHEIRDIMSLDFPLYVSDGVNSIPNRVTKFVTQKEPTKVMPSVKSFETDRLSITDEILRNFPNVEEIIGPLAENVHLNPRTLRLTKLTISNYHPVDLSQMSTLRELTIGLKINHLVGYSALCSYRIPTTLRQLSLTEVFDHWQIHVEEGKHLESLRFFMSGMSKGNMGNLKLPFGLKELDASGPATGAVPCVGLHLPQTMERILIGGFSVMSFDSLPQSLCFLSFGDGDVYRLDGLEELDNLTTMVLNNEYLGDVDFPPNLEKLELHDHHNVNPMAFLTKLRYLNHTFEDSDHFPKRIVVGPAMSQLTLVNENIEEIVGGERLDSLWLSGCDCEDMTKWKFDNLSTLELRNGTTFYCLPFCPSLRYLSMTNIELEAPFVCPDNLRFLSFKNTAYPHRAFSPLVIQEDGKSPLNERLEALVLIGASFDFKRMFHGRGRYLKQVLLQGCQLDELDADFTSTDLEEFLVVTTAFKPGKVKFPKCLKALAVAENDRYGRGNSFVAYQSLNWVDISECKELCSFENYGESYSTKEARRSYEKLEAEMLRIQETF